MSVVILIHVRMIIMIFNEVDYGDEDDDDDEDGNNVCTATWPNHKILWYYLLPKVLLTGKLSKF